MMNSNGIKPVIVAIGYNRKESLNRLLFFLDHADYEIEDITLVISLDFGGGEEILSVANDFEWHHGKKIVRTFDVNQGLKEHLLACADLSVEYGAAILFEDDIVPAPNFYSYTLQAVEKYKANKKILGLALYSNKKNVYVNRQFIPMNNSYDAYFSKVAESWGECFIGDAWRDFREWYNDGGKDIEQCHLVPDVINKWNKSWCRYVMYYLSIKDKYFVVPYDSYATNFNDAGVHISNGSCVFQQPLTFGKKTWRFPDDDAIKYDAYFENIGLKDKLDSKYGKRVCVDYYGIRSDREKYDLCLSSCLLPFAIVDSYALNMKPYELNVLNEMKGDSLFVYDMKKPKKLKKNRAHHFHMIKYEYGDIPAKDALFYFIYQLLYENKRN